MIIYCGGLIYWRGPGRSGIVLTIKAYSVIDLGGDMDRKVSSKLGQCNPDL